MGGGGGRERRLRALSRYEVALAVVLAALLMVTSIDSITAR